MPHIGSRLIIASVALALGTAELCAQPLGYYDEPYPYPRYAPLPPAAFYPPPPSAYAPPQYFPPPPAVYYPRPLYEYGPPPAREYGPPSYAELPPPRPTSCGKYRYWNGEYCADARFERPYVGPRW
jgi:hypothetical protein